VTSGSAAGRVRRIAIVAHATFPADPRVRRQADLLVEAGYAVDCFVLRDRGQQPAEHNGGLRVFRLPVRRRFVGFAGHMAEYLAFSGMAGIRLTAENWRRRYDLVQVATLPDFLVIAASVPKLTGVPLLLDLHEDMPAFFEDRFAAPWLRPLRSLTRGVARASAAMADAVITVHEPLRRLSLERGLAPDKITVVMNSPDERIFDPDRYPRRAFMEDGELRLIHSSSLQRIYGLGVAIQAVAELRDEIPVRLDVYGDGPYHADATELIRELMVADRVELRGRVALEELPRLLAASDLALVPSLPEPYLQYSLSTKLLEAVAMGLPVVASDLATFRAHFSSEAVRYVPGGDPHALALAIRDLANDPIAAAAHAAEARRQAADYAWATQGARYLDVVRRLV
jgi:glycosyltransferase involved in cell wall biosynthesis